MKKLLLLIFFWLLSGTVHAAPVDAPHNAANQISCNTCHTYTTWWQYSPADSTSQTYLARINTLCLSCHDGNAPYPAMKAHNSETLGEGNHGIWVQNCIDCHDPHDQAQLTAWLATNPDDLFLVTGHMNTTDNGNGTFSYVYTINGDGTTDISIDSAATLAKSGWDSAASWISKNSNSVYNRGLIFVHSTSEAYNTYSVTGGSDSIITIKGSFDPSSADPEQDATFGLIYGQLVKANIQGATVLDPSTKSSKPVKFFDPNQLYGLGGFTDQETPRSGICQVCHTQTSHWTEDGLNDDHNPSKVCTNCHLRDEGFLPTAGGHSNGDGTFGWDTACATCHDPSASAEIIADIHKVGSDNTCVLCHETEAGGTLNPATSANNATVGSTPHLCSECHIDSTSQHHATAKAQWGDCTWCHADPRPQWEINFSVTGTKPRQLACRQCHVEPDGTGLVVYKLDYPVTTSDTMSFPFGDLHQPANNSKSVIKTLMDGTNGTTNHSIPGSSKIDIYDYSTCLSCHDGVRATAVNVWHARPKYSEIPTDSSTDAVRMHFDVLKYAPGRNIFNLWRGDGTQGEPYFSHDEKFYDTSGAAQVRGKDFFDSQNRRNLPWNSGSASSPIYHDPDPMF